MKNSLKSQRGFWNKLRDANVGNKVLSVIFAIVFWLYVMDQTNPEITKLIEGKAILFQNLNDISEKNLVITSIYPETIDVKLSGRRADLLKTGKASVELTCNVGNLKEGSNTLYVKSAINSKDSGNGGKVRIASMSSDKVVFEVERLVSVSKPVRVDLINEIPSDKSIEQVRSSIENVMVTGPNSNVEKIAVLSASVDVNDIIQSGEITVNLVPLDSKAKKVEGVTLSQRNVRVSGISKSIVNIPVEVVLSGEPREGFSIGDVVSQPSQVNVKLFTNDAVGDNVPKSIKTVPIDIEGISDTKSVYVDVVIPPDVGESTGITGVNVEIPVYALPVRKIIMKGKDVRIVNLSNTLKAKRKYPEKLLSISVPGNLVDIGAVNKSNIVLRADMSGLGAGTHTVEVNAYFMGKKLETYDNKKITVTLKRK